MLNLSNVLAPALADALTQLANPRPQTPVQQLAVLTQKRLGEVIEALVKKVIPLSERQLQIVQPRLPGASSNSPVKALVLEFIASNKTTVVISDQPVEPGQRVQARLTTKGLQLLASPEKPASGIRADAAKPAQGRIETKIPLARPLNQLLNSLAKTPGLTSPAKDLFNQLSKSIATPQQLLEPNTIKARIKSSGLFLESYFSRQLAEKSVVAATKTLFSKQPPLPTTQAGSLRVLRSALETTTGKPFTGNVSATATPAEPVVTNKVFTVNQELPGAGKSSLSGRSEGADTDIKGLLLQLRKIVAADLQGDQTKPLSRENSAEREPIYFPTLVNGLPGKTTAHAITQLSTPKPLTLQEQLQQISQQIQLALNRIQSQQLNSTSEGHERIDHQQTFQLDLPVRVGEQIHNVVILLTPPPVEEKAEEQRRADKNIRQHQGRWIATLAIDLGDAGDFYAEISANSDNVDLKLWAEKSSTWQQILADQDNLLKQLNDAGIEVRHNECHCGQPNEAVIRLNYSLVDITT